MQHLRLRMKVSTAQSQNVSLLDGLIWVFFYKSSISTIIKRLGARLEMKMRSVWYRFLKCSISCLKIDKIFRKPKQSLVPALKFVFKLSSWLYNNIAAFNWVTGLFPLFVLFFVFCGVALSMPELFFVAMLVPNRQVISFFLRRANFFDEAEGCYKINIFTI